MSVKTPHSTDKHVGNRVRTRRMMLGLTQEKLADALRLTFQQVQKYEKGANQISASRLQHLSDILHVPIGYFFEGNPEQSKTVGSAPSFTYVTEYLATSDGIALTKAFTDIKNTKLRRSIVALVKQIADG